MGSREPWKMCKQGIYMYERIWLHHRPGEQVQMGDKGQLADSCETRTEVMRPGLRQEMEQKRWHLGSSRVEFPGDS